MVSIFMWDCVPSYYKAVFAVTQAGVKTQIMYDHVLYHRLAVVVTIHI